MTQLYIIMLMILLLPLRYRLNLQFFLLLVRKPLTIIRNHSPLIYLPCLQEQDVSYLVAFKCEILDTSSAMMDTMT